VTIETGATAVLVATEKIIQDSRGLKCHLGNATDSQ